jgi:hypothetical protein
MDFRWHFYSTPDTQRQYYDLEQKWVDDAGEEKWEIIMPFYEPPQPPKGMIDNDKINERADKAKDSFFVSLIKKLYLNK